MAVGRAGPRAAGATAGPPPQRWEDAVGKSLSTKPESLFCCLLAP